MGDARAAITGIVLALFLLPLAFSLGWVLLRFLLRFTRSPEPVTGTLLLSAEGFLQAFVFGLLVILIFQLALLSFGLPWNVVTACVLFVGGYALSRARPALHAACAKAWHGAAHLNFALWFFVICVLGGTLLGAHKGLETAWVNNYGDVAWHIGMITSFTFGKTFPAEYHIFPGARLSYPFLINLWTASQWWINPGWWYLGVIFFLQWTICWFVIYAAVRGNRNWLLPWAILFGGGAAILFYRSSPLMKEWKTLGGYAHNLIERGFPWTPFLTTVWVTQRPALFGAAVILTGLAIFHRFLITAKEERDLRTVSVLVAVPLALSVLAHTHLFLVTVLYIATWFVLRIAMRAMSGVRLFSRERKWSAFGPFNDAILSALICAVLLVPCAAFFPLIWGKKSTLAFTPGWMPWRWMAKGNVLSALADSFMLWLTNAEGWLLCALLLTIFLPKRRELLALLVVFIAGNVIRTSYWEWDQIKVFTGIYLAFISLWAYAEERFPESSAVLRKLQIACIALILPGFAEFTDAFFYRFKNHTVYSEHDLQLASAIVHLTPPDAIVLAAPDHNSPVTLTGRRLFEGYNGTLSSHGLDYSKREQLTKDFERVIHCRDPRNVDVVPPSLCPRYLVWTERERRFWPGKNPAAVPSLKRTASADLWEIL